MSDRRARSLGDRAVHPGPGCIVDLHPHRHHLRPAVLLRLAHRGRGALPPGGARGQPGPLEHRAGTATGARGLPQRPHPRRGAGALPGRRRGGRHRHRGLPRRRRAGPRLGARRARRGRRQPGAGRHREPPGPGRAPGRGGGAPGPQPRRGQRSGSSGRACSATPTRWPPSRRPGAPGSAPTSRPTPTTPSGRGRCSRARAGRPAARWCSPRRALRRHRPAARFGLRGRAGRGDRGGRHPGRDAAGRLPGPGGEAARARLRRPGPRVVRRVLGGAARRGAPGVLRARRGVPGRAGPRGLRRPLRGDGHRAGPGQAGPHRRADRPARPRRGAGGVPVRAAGVVRGEPARQLLAVRHHLRARRVQRLRAALVAPGRRRPTARRHGARGRDGQHRVGDRLRQRGSGRHGRGGPPAAAPRRGGAGQRAGARPRAQPRAQDGGDACSRRSAIARRIARRPRVESPASE